MSFPRISAVVLALVAVCSIGACSSSPADGEIVEENSADAARSYEEDTRFVPNEPGGKAEHVPTSKRHGVANRPTRPGVKTSASDPGNLPIDKQNAAVIAKLGGTVDATFTVTEDRKSSAPVEDQQAATSGTIRIVVSRAGLPPLDLTVSVGQWEPVLEVVDRLSAQITREWRPYASRKGNRIEFRAVRATFGDAGHTGLKLSWRFDSKK